jgi:tripartite-type tricarboxylate transporter receptor subunit TctC
MNHTRKPRGYFLPSGPVMLLFGRLAALRTVLFGALFTGACLIAAGTAKGEEIYPTRPVRMVMPFPPGGAGDAGARVLADALTAYFKQPVVVDNRAGANGNIGADNVAKSAPDGYSILFASMGTMTINPFIYQKMPFVAERDLVPVAKVFDVALVIEANPSLGLRSLKDLIDYAKKYPGKLTYASGGNGSSTHMGGELFKYFTGTDLVHVPYKGNGPALTDVLGGNVNVMFDQVASSAQYINAGKLVAFAVTSPKRQPSIPGVPTVRELGHPQLEMSSWSGVMAPAGTPPAIIERTAKAIDTVLADPQVKQRMEALGTTVSPSTPAELGTLLQDERVRWKQVVSAAKIKSD